MRVPGSLGVLHRAFVRDGMVECAQLESRCWIMSESVPKSMSIGELIERMQDPGYGRGFRCEAMGMAVCVIGHKDDKDEDRKPGDPDDDVEPTSGNDEEGPYHFVSGRPDDQLDDQ